MMNSRALALTLAGLALSLILTTPERASAFCRMTTEGGAQVGNSACVEDGEFLEWSVPCLSYSIDNRGSIWMDFADVETAVDASFAAWQDQECASGSTNLIFKRGEPSTCRRAEYREFGGPNVNTIAFLDPWEDACGEPYDLQAFAVTIVWFNTQTGEMLDADMLINEALGPYDNCPDTGCPPGTRGNPGPADLASIVTHEAGHFIGIGHSNIQEATMFASSPRGDIDKRTLAQDDISAVCSIYPPGGLTESCNAEPRGGLDLNCEDDGPASCDGGPTTVPSNGGCSACRVGRGESPFGMAFLALLALTVWRRRSRPLDERY